MSTPPAPPPARRAPPPEPLGAARFKVQFTADQALIDKLEEARQLASHRIPDGDVAKLVDEALELLCEKLRKERFAELVEDAEDPPAELAPGRVEKASRHIPHRVRRAVVKRDGGQCTYIAPNGRRCQERRLIEFHHLEPWARDPVHTADGIMLRCRTHNQYQARLDFGAEVIEAHVAARGRRKLASS